MVFNRGKKQIVAQMLSFKNWYMYFATLVCIINKDKSSIYLSWIDLFDLFYFYLPYVQGVVA
jgi:hypothetical protein